MSPKTLNQRVASVWEREWRGRKLSQTAAAKIIGIPRISLGRRLRAENDALWTLPQLESLARYLNVPLEDLIPREYLNAESSQLQATEEPSDLEKIVSDVVADYIETSGVQLSPSYRVTKTLISFTAKILVSERRPINRENILECLQTVLAKRAIPTRTQNRRP